MNVDFLIIGGGPAGYHAALRAAELGLKTALITAEPPGGCCLHRGCIPTKTLLEQARSGRWAPAAVLPVTAQLTEGLRAQLRRARVTVVAGRARFRAPHEVELDDQTRWSAPAVLLATGSEPWRPAWLPESPRVLDSDAFLRLPQLPERLLILGGGVIGCEFAELAARCGARVTVVELADRLLPGLDRELGRELEQGFARRGIEVVTGVRAELSATDAEVRLRTPDREFRGELLLAALGRRGSGDAPELAGTGLRPEARGFLAVDGAGRTAVPGVYAAGDLTGPWLLAHAAARQGRQVAEVVAGLRTELETSPVPQVVYTAPELAAVGWSEEECRTRGVPWVRGKAYLAVNGRALAAGESGGFAKVLAERDSGRLLGVQLAGAAAAENIDAALIALTAGLDVQALAALPAAHPTRSEALHEAAQQAAEKCAAAAARRRH